LSADLSRHEERSGRSVSSVSSVSQLVDASPPGGVPNAHRIPLRPPRPLRLCVE
jgi:hypothetical protein